MLSETKMLNAIILQMVRSWAATEEGVHSTSELLQWIEEKNSTTHVNIEKIPLSECLPWTYNPDSGRIQNQDGSFFTISGFRQIQSGEVIHEQPIILQEEIGYLGIICKEIGGILHFLMQAKIEPGNVNKVQISPTIQATKSNFTQKHGGGKPAYLEYFLDVDSRVVVVDQIQSEQSSRFYKKRNRNIIILVEEEVEVLPSHKWMTLGQIKQLMKYDNLVNMDTRTVLSCIPYSLAELTNSERDEIKSYFSNPALFTSIFADSDVNYLPEIYHYINNYKMFNDTQTELVPLHHLTRWEMRDSSIASTSSSSFQVIYCHIEIEGREVVRWTQPLFEAMGKATFGLICCEDYGVLKFLVHAKPEVGCFDQIELGPSVQLEADCSLNEGDSILQLFMRCRSNPDCVVCDVVLSEEGGRFYCEENHNVIVKAEMSQLTSLPPGYFLVDFKTLNRLVQVNNCLNIQLRNLLSLLDI